MPVMKIISAVVFAAITVSILITTSASIEVTIWVIGMLVLVIFLLFLNFVQSVIIWIASQLHKHRINRKKDLKDVGYLEVLGRVIFNRVSLFTYFVSIYLCHFSGNLNYLWMVPAYIAPSITLLSIIKKKQ